MTTITRTYNSTVERIIAEEIRANASWMVQELKQDAEGRYIEDLMPCLSAPDYCEAPTGYRVQRGADDPSAWYWYDTDAEYEEDEEFEQYSSEREAIIAAWEDSGDEPDDIEAAQHWIVSDWLADKLEEVGALVARDIMGFEIWGRTDGGQGLELNHDLQRVAELLDNADL